MLKCLISCEEVESERNEVKLKLNTTQCIITSSTSSLSPLATVKFYFHVLQPVTAINLVFKWRMHNQADAH